jgi:deoxyribonuclease-4
VFGSHLSIAGGLHKALLSAEKLGMDTVQVFTANPRSFGTSAKPVHPVTVQNLTKNQQQWKSPPLADAAAAEWCSHCTRLKFAQTVSHDSYLINLASPDEALWRKSIGLFAEELRRCVVLKIPYLVTHPGAHMGQGEDAGLTRVAQALDAVHKLVPASGGVTTCLEITAGQGSALGYRLEHLAEIIAQVRAPQRLGVCLDTAHLFAAGYDFRGRRYAKFRKELESTVGIARVKVLHLNDSKKELGSRVDRHDHIGRGLIGLEGFKPFVRDKSFKGVPKILETPKEGKSDDGRDWDAVNLEALRALM